MYILQVKRRSWHRYKKFRLRKIEDFFLALSQFQFLKSVFQSSSSDCRLDTLLGSSSLQGKTCFLDIWFTRLHPGQSKFLLHKFVAPCLSLCTDSLEDTGCSTYKIIRFRPIGTRTLSSLLSWSIRQSKALVLEQDLQTYDLVGSASTLCLLPWCTAPSDTWWTGSGRCKACIRILNSMTWCYIPGGQSSHFV